MNLAPSADYRYVLKKGMSGTDVAALQLNLHGVAADGVFGSQTKAAVSGFQEKHGLTVDGIAGLATQQKLCVALSTDAARASGLPVGLLKSLVANESGFAVAAFSRHPSDAGFDLGAYQDSIEPGMGTQERYRHAYSIAEMAEETAKKVARQRDAYAHPVYSWYLEHIGGADKAIFAWQLAVLYHNWPVASEGINERGSIFVDASRDTEPAQWVIDASAGRLSTPREWVVSYIERATVFVDW